MHNINSQKNIDNSIPKIVKVTEEAYNKLHSQSRGKNEDVENLLEAIDRGIKKRKLKSDKFDKE